MRYRPFAELVWILLWAPMAMSTERGVELQQIVAAERAFAARAQIVNPRQAFAEFFAPDAILFAPFATPAFPRLRDTKDWAINIQWRPVAAAVSGAGDMGYTTGPSEYRRSPGEAPVGFGHYTSVWERQPDGRFLVRIDAGVEHPAPTARAQDWMAPADPGPHAEPLQPVARSVRANELKDLDAGLGTAKVTADSIAPLLADDARWHRGGQLPVVGRRAVLDAVATAADMIEWLPEAAVVAASGDFGYTYGRGRWQRGDSESGELAYLNVWQRRNGGWRLLVHVSNAVEAPR